MEWYKIFAITALAICFASLLYHLIRLIKLDKPIDLSTPTGNTGAATRHAFTGAMSPAKKESAFLHLPTYMAGIIYHLGTFLSIALFFFFIFNVNMPSNVLWLVAVLLVISGLCGFGILFKRMLKAQLRALSIADDYISNILVSVFQLITATALLNHNPDVFYYIISGLLFLYIPVGKLKHTIYFFAARYHLGFFFGQRGVWPPKKL